MSQSRVSPKNLSRAQPCFRPPMHGLQKTSHPRNSAPIKLNYTDDNEMLMLLKISTRSRYEGIRLVSFPYVFACYSTFFMLSSLSTYSAVTIHDILLGWLKYQLTSVSTIVTYN